MRAFRDVQTVLTTLCGLALVLSFFGIHPWLPYAAVAFGSWFALKSAYGSLRERSIDVNFLMVFAAAGAVVVPFLGAHAAGTERHLTPAEGARDAAALLFLFSLSSTLEAFAMSRTRSAIEGLIKLRPDEALRVRAGVEERVAVGQLVVGDEVRVPPFDSVPVDGTVLSGESTVNEAAMTGESVPVAKRAGDRVLAGTQNLEGLLTVRVTGTVGDSTLDKIVNLVRDAQENKASGERISQWFGQRYTFFVVGAFLVSLLIRVALQIPMSDAIYASLVLLVALSPCALVISTPATTLSALAWAGRRGILVRGGEFIERCASIDTLALDKTGTLTRGRPELSEICVCREAVLAGAGCHATDACWSGGADLSREAREILALAAAAETHSSHPIAEAIVRAAEERGVPVPEATHVTAHSGLGVQATVEGRTVQVGQRRFFEGSGVPLPEPFLKHVEQIQADGMTVAILHDGDRFAALGLRDAPREGAAAFVREMEGLGVREIVMLTGDTPQTAKAVAERTGIARVEAGLLPDQKRQVLDGLLARSKGVMMIGDGINDAPSLARAHVGVAMGGLGSDIALNAADVVLMGDRLDRVPDLVRLGRKTARIIRANLLFAGGVIVTLTVLSLFFKLPLPLAVLGHEGSTVLVILNGLRLLRGP